jgi:hypothetical protein
LVWAILNQLSTYSMYNIIVRTNMDGTDMATFLISMGEDLIPVLTSVFVGSDGKIYVAESEIPRIECMDDMNGAGWKTFGTSGNGSKQFWGPTSIFVK